MIVYIPLAIGQSVKPDVTCSILAQSLKCDIVHVKTDGFIGEIKRKEDRIKKLEGIMLSRNKIVEKFLKTEDKFCIIQDSDVVHNDSDNLKLAYDRIQDDDRLGAVYVNGTIKTGLEHYNLQCAIFRREVFDNFRFRFDDQLHGCNCARDDLKNNGWKIEMLSQNIQRIRNIKYAQ